MGETGKKLAALFQKKNALFLIGITGILLIFLSDTLFAETKTDPGANIQRSAEEYSARMETRLEDALAQIEGVGDVKVFVTLEDGGESVFALDEKSDTETQSEQDGGSRRSSSWQTEHVLSGGSPVLESVLEPGVKGVSVVCEGGDDITVVSRVTEFVSVGLGLPTNRVCVTKMK